MAITTFGALKAAVADEFNNSALASRIAHFVNPVHTEIVRWCDPATNTAPLVADTDTNDVLVQFPDVYRYGILSRGCAFARDYTAAQIYEAQFQAQLRELAYSTLALPDGVSGQHTLSTP